MTPQRSVRAPLTRKQSVKAMKDAKIVLTDGDVCFAGAIKLMASLGHLKATQRHLIVAEFATRLWMRTLNPLGTLHSQFEEDLWIQLSKEADLEKLVGSLARNEIVFDDARKRYYAYIQGMFQRSEKSREEFYNEMLAEAGVNIELGEVDFGERAAAFGDRTMGSLHQEHLLVWYSARLLLKARKTIHPTCPQITEGVLEALYKHFEDAIPLRGKFYRYSASIAHFEPDVKLWLLPSLD